VTSPQARKGAAFERFVVDTFRALGYPDVERAYGAGRPDDKGDLDGMPGVYAQLKHYADPWRAVREALEACDHSDQPWPVGMVRYARNPNFIVVMRPAVFADLHREANQ